jgi:hypothetical protein
MATNMATNNGMKPTKRVLLAATLSGLFLSTTQAQDPPSRVADLNYVTGNVSIQPAGADDWAPAAVNRPFTTGDNLWADTDGRAELHLNNATLRVGAQSSLGFLNLDDHFAQIRFSQGEFFLRVRRLGDDDSFEVDTPNAAITILREGEYRFNADPDAGTTGVVVRHGEAEITGGGQAFTVRAGNSAQLSGTDQLAYDVGTVPPPDDLDGWCEDRDNREARMQTARYLPPDVIGYEELDSYGDWRDTPGYGAVWYPRVYAGWAPYHDGHWAWVEPWGWTWVDDAPWGFAPSHYGRWAYANGGWGWVPGPMAIMAGRPSVAAVVYAPALVAFIGGGGWGASLSIGGPAVGWVPLGPGEVYAPSYAISQNYFRTVNVSNTTVVNTVNITNVYNTVYVNKSVTNITVNQHFANMAAPNAVTAMPQNSFASGRPVKQGGISVPAAQVAQVSAHMAVAPSVAPVKQALAPTAGARPAPRPPASAASVQVVAKKTPPPAPVPFAAKQAALQQNAGRPLNMQTVRQSVPPARVAAAPAVKVAPPSRPVTPQVHSAPPAPPARTPAPAAMPANRPPAATPAAPPRPTPQSNPRPVQPAPQPTPAYRPPAATPPPARTAPESNPRPTQPAPQPQSRPAERPAPSAPQPQQRPAERPAPPPTQPRPAERPAPQNNPRPPAAAPAKPTQKPKKETEKEKEKSN